MAENWKHWINSHGAQLLLFARQQARNKNDAEDILQEAFFRLWKYERQNKQVSLPVLYKCIRQTAIDFARRTISHERKQEAVALEPIDKAEWFQRSLEKEEISDALQQAIKTLPDEQQEVLVLKIWSDLSFQEIAETLDISINTASSRYRYALEKLRDKVNQQQLRNVY